MKWCIQFSELKEPEQNQILLDWVHYSRLVNPMKNKKLKTFLISYHAAKVNNEALQPLQKAVCTSTIMAICGVGDETWSSIIDQATNSATAKQHGSKNNNNAKIPEDNPVIRNLTEHFKKVKSMAEVTATRVVREMSGEVTLRDLSDTKKCLPPWLIMHDSYREYALKCGYEVTFNNRSHASSKWVGKGPEPKRGIISYTCFCQYWNENHSNLVVSLPTKDICSLCHALSNHHCYNLSHDLLFCKETDEVRENNAGDLVTEDSENTLECDPPDWDSDKEDLSPPNGQSKELPPTHAQHVPVGIPEVETREQMLL